MINRELEIAKEIEQIALEHNISVNDLLEQYKKAHNSTDQSKSYELSKIINDSITE